MFFGLSHVDVPVRDLDRALSLYVGVIGFMIKKRGEGWVDLDTGTSQLRLLQSRNPEHSVAIRVQVSDVDAAFQLMLARGSVALYEPARTPELEHVASVRDADGHTITLWRELTEDEYGFDPELPKQMTWRADADELLKSLLRTVPALFRGLARRKISRNAEHLARHTNLVTKDEVVRSFIISSAKVTRHRVHKPLLDHGYNPQHYPQELDA